MSRTYKKEYRTSLFKHGSSNTHHSLKKEMYECQGGFVAQSRGLIDKRDYQSDRMKGFRNVENHRRRSFQKEKTMKMIKNAIDDEQDLFY